MEGHQPPEPARRTSNTSFSVGEIFFQGPILQRLLSRFFSPGNILGIFRSLELFLVGFDWQNDGDCLAVAGHDFRFSLGSFARRNV
jgi:hypothetical protein